MAFMTAKKKPPYGYLNQSERKICTNKSYAFMLETLGESKKHCYQKHWNKSSCVAITSSPRDTANISPQFLTLL